MAFPVSADLDLQGFGITNLRNATAANEPATKAQLDALALGQQWFAPVRIAATANHSRSGLAAIDGVTPSAGDRVLLPAQTAAAENGIYVAASGAWTRATDADESAEVRSTRFVAVQEGTANGDTNWQMTTDGTITVGTTALTWQKIGTGGTAYTGTNGVTVSGSMISAKIKAGGGVLADGDGLSIDPSYTGLAKRYAQDVPAGTNPTITHNLGTKDVQVVVRRISDGAQMLTPNTAPTVNTVGLEFGSNPNPGTYRVTILA